eukprot:scaffold30425_cov112-Isochrysis_galbana.AAC.1
MALPPTFFHRTAHSGPVLHTCFTPASHLLHTCLTPAPHLLHTCLTPSSHLLHTCPTPASHLPHTFFTPASHQVLHSFDAWLADKGFVNTPEKRTFAFCADGHFDLQFFLD